MPDGDTIGKSYHGKKEEALSLMNKGLLGGHNKENANEGDRHSQYSKKGSNPQGLPPTLNRQFYFT
jgi:hypothetical protein